LAGSSLLGAVLTLERQFDSVPVMTVAIGSLRGADSPRLSGESLRHTRLLAHSDALLPPIIVHRETMRVIDGMHRVRAALLRGEQEIQVRFYARVTVIARGRQGCRCPHHRLPPAVVGSGHRGRNGVVA
jgi:hypothetical protein